MTDFQPTLPSEVTDSGVGQVFIADSPFGLWPTNGNSNFGLLRRSLVSPLDDLVGSTNSLFNNLFIATVDTYLSRWEDMLGLPVAPGGISMAQRRALCLGRIQKRPYTKQRVKDTVEAFINATFGEAVSLTTGGVEITSGGIPLHDEYADVTTLYAITYGTFTVTVNVDPGIGIDEISMTRELEYFIPAGIHLYVTRT